MAPEAKETALQKRLLSSFSSSTKRDERDSFYNFSPSYQRHFPRNRKRDKPTLVRISSLSGLDRFRPQSFLFHIHSSTIQPNIQHCTFKKVVKYYGEQSTHRSNKPITLSRFLTFAIYFHDKVRENKESVTRHIGFVLQFSSTTTHQTRPNGRTMLWEFLGEHFHTSWT